MGCQSGLDVLRVSHTMIFPLEKKNEDDSNCAGTMEHKLTSAPPTRCVLGGPEPPGIVMGGGRGAGHACNRVGGPGSRPSEALMPCPPPVRGHPLSRAVPV